MAASASNSVTNSPISSTPHSPRPPQRQEVASPTVPEESKEKVVKDPLDDIDSQQIEKFKRYEVESSRYLMSKYFSDKTIFGELRTGMSGGPLAEGNIFDVKMTINGEQIKVSRFPGYQSYADPANFNDDSGSDTISTVETTPLSANGQQPFNKGY